MNKTPSKPSLVWNVNKPIGKLGDTEIFLAPGNQAPLKPDAQLEEQDSALLMREPDAEQILEPSEKPLWYFAHKLTQDITLETGSINILTKHTPPIVQAIVHDFEQDPSCTQVWIKSALQQLFNISDTKQWRKIHFPIFQPQVNAIMYTDIPSFFGLLLDELRHKRPIEQLWISGTPQKLDAIHQYLKNRYHV